MVNIAENLREVRHRMNAACLRAGRDPKAVRLIAVSKKKPFADIMTAYDAGARDFGENYVQELTEKLAALREIDPAGEKRPRWHMIGHLQKNKVKYLIGQVALIHSVDSLPLAQRIEKEAAKAEAVMDILMEVNVAEEESKWGFAADQALEAAREISMLPHVRLLGLMTSAPYTEEPESNRVYFRMLKKLAMEMQEQGLIAASEEFRTPVLSMGMSGDYEVAAEEGATLVRVGTSVFGERIYS